MASKAKAASLLTPEIIHHLFRYDPEQRDLWWIQPGPKRRLDRPAGAIAIRGRPNGPKTRYRVIGLSVKPGVYEKHYAHELVFFYMTGRWADPEVDHINQNGLDNRWCNLREATRSEACANRVVRPNALKGAYRVAGSSTLWFSHIKKDGKTTYLGCFRTEQEAHDAFVEASKRLHGRFHRVKRDPE